MKIHEEKCTGCGLCVPYCPVEAISMRENVAVIDHDECVDCGVCLRAEVGPPDCIIFEPASWPYSLRCLFTDLTRENKQFGILGHGVIPYGGKAETVCCNDVVGLFTRGRIGVGLTIGRPNVGTRLRDVEKLAQAMAKVGGKFEPQQPINMLMEDKSRGKLREDVLNEKVLWVELTCVFPIEKLKDALTALKEVSKDVDTVFGVSLITRIEPDDSFPVEMETALADLDMSYYIWSKNNVGLGRPHAKGGK